ncbi:MAG: phosphate-starvation-inducible PsiE family protein [Gammaproteobacteria bacterium]|nr:phosphate-starvation-inducible PsiE family protein [Gammaproteobacteria bacterium]
MKFSPLEIFHKTISVVFGVMLFVITLGIIFGVLRLMLNLGDLALHASVTKQYLAIISDVLTLFILIELSRSLVDYFHEQRLRMTFIVDAAIVFVLREIMIKLFEHSITAADIYAMSVLLLVLGMLRIGSVLVYQREKLMLKEGKS